MEWSAVVVCLLVGVLIAFIVTGVMKSQLHSVAMQQGACYYVRPESLHLTIRQDVFLYRNVTKHAKPKNDK